MIIGNASAQLGLDYDSHLSGPSSGEVVPAVATGQRQHPGTHKRKNKRRREPSIDDVSKDGGAAYIQDGSSERKRPRPGTVDVKRFACPFLKRDPIHHMDCVYLTLTRIQDVKQHLQRRHYQASIYCPVCQREFPDTHRRDDHIRKRGCTEHPPCQRDPSTESIPFNKQCKLRSRIKGSDEKLWYQIWDIIFDDVQRPETPYQMTAAEEVAIVLQRFWVQDHLEIISDILPEHAQDVNSDAIRPQLPSLVAAALSRLVDRLKEAIHGALQTSPSSCPSRSSSIIASTSTEETPVIRLSPAPLLEGPMSEPCSMPQPFYNPALLACDTAYKNFGTYKGVGSIDLLGIQRPFIDVDRTMGQSLAISYNNFLLNKSWDPLLAPTPTVIDLTASPQLGVADQFSLGADVLQSGSN